MKSSFLPLVGLALVVSASSAQAASYNFNYTFDGTSISQNAGSDTADGTSLNVGDDFTIMLSTAGDDYFQVVNNFQQYFPMSYALTESAGRTGNVVSSFYLDGGLVNTITESNVLQQYVHVGAQDWSLASGLEFDKIVLTYDFVSIDSAVATVINEDTDVFGDFSNDNRPFFNDGNISYVSAVPLPAAMPLLAFAVAGLGMIGRRRRRS